MTRARAVRGSIGRALAGLLLGVVGPAQAEPPPNLPASLSEPFARFEALVAAARQHDDLPRLADPGAAPVLRAIWAGAAGPADLAADPGALTGDGAVESAELSVLLTYVYFPKPSPDPIDYDRLATRFGPEIARSLAASIAAAARLSAHLERFRASHRGLGADKTAALRDASLDPVIQAEKFMATAAFQPADAAVVAAAFGDAGEDFALIFGRDDRAAIADSLRPILPQLDAAAARDLGRFLDALRTARCGELCADP